MQRVAELMFALRNLSGLRSELRSSVGCSRVGLASERSHARLGRMQWLTELMFALRCLSGVCSD